MPRITAVYRPADHPARADPAVQAGLEELFGYLFPGKPDPEIPRDHAGIAIAAQNPRLALKLAQLSRFIALETGWCERADLRELAIATLNRKFRSDFSFQARLHHARAAGLSEAQLAALPDGAASGLFDDEQRLVIDYTLAVVAGDVPEALFARVVAAYGEAGAVEFTTVVGFWSFWAMLINAVRPSFDAEA
jgi:4-carboxymuconolactone decarboxylase